MWLTMLKAKIHGARVTDKQLDYEGSLTIDRALMDYVQILPYEKVLVANLENGQRFETYAIPGAAGTVCLNGAAALLGNRGDRLIIFAFAQVPVAEAPQHRPRILRVDENNRPAGGLLAP